MNLNPEIIKIKDTIIDTRRDFHKHPELSFQEKRTSKIVGDRLESYGLKVSRNIGKTGVIGVLKGKTSGKSIALRADMDALPIIETTNCKYSSKNKGIMHACGHDGHTTMLLGAAKYLSENNDFDGNVYFIFQPGEEGFAGGQKMIQDGMFDDFKIDEVYALHNWPELPIGTIGVNNGPMMAAVDEFDIIVKGKGGHAAFPQNTVDPIVISSQIILSIQTIISRFISPVEKALISITKINGGSAYNVIDDKVVLNGTVRTFNPDIREKIDNVKKEISKETREGN